MALPHLRSPRRVAFARVGLASLGGFYALGASYVVIPPIAVERLGGDEVLIGWAITAFAAASLAIRLGVGAVVDRRGPALAVGIGLAVTGLGGAVFFVAVDPSILLLGRVLQGFGQAFVFTAGLSWAIGLAPSERRGQAISLFGLSIWAGLTIGPVLTQWTLDAFGITAAVSLLVIMPALGLVGLIGIPRPVATPFGSGARALAIPLQAIRPALGLAAGGVVMAGIVGFAVVTFDQRDGGGGEYVIGAYGAATVLGRIALGRLPDRFGWYPTGVVAFVLALIGALVIAFSPTWPLAVLGGLVGGIAWSLLFPSLALVAVNRSPVERRGSAVAVYTAGFDLGFAVGAPLLGLVAVQAGYAAVYVVGAGFAIVGLILVLAMRATSGREEAVV
jgi:MFS family permease